MPFTDQSSFDVRCEWGPHSVAALADCRTFIIVDVLSFCTCVAMAADRGVTILPYPARDGGAAAFAQEQRALLAGPRGAGYSLSPSSLTGAPRGTRLVLPSPNGAALSLQAGSHGSVLAGCLRNRSSVAARAAALGGPIAIIPAGELWDDGTLRPSLEDLLGAGAIGSMLPGTRSPETVAAIATFESVSSHLLDSLLACSSGRELVERGFAEDVRLAAELDVDAVAPELVDSEFRTRGVFVSPKGAIVHSQGCKPLEDEGRVIVAPVLKPRRGDRTHPREDP
jgi:2-phosphosulfolactate phosphatase